MKISFIYTKKLWAKTATASLLKKITSITALCLSAVFMGNVNAQTISTVAGNTTTAYSGDGYSALLAGIGESYSVAADNAGNLYILDWIHSVLRKVDVYGIITTIAGTTNGYSGDGGPATLAQMSYPIGICFDNNTGDIYISDYNNAVIRMIDVNGIIHTVAGNHSIGFSGDGGPATNAELNSCTGVAVDQSGNLFITDIYNYDIRKVDAYGYISTYAGEGPGYGGYTGDGGLATNAEIGGNWGICTDLAGNVYFVCGGNIRVIYTTGYIYDFAGNNTSGFSGDGGNATDAQLYMPIGVNADGFGNIYISEVMNSDIRIVNTAGIINTYAGNHSMGYSGDGGLAVNAEFYGPWGIATDNLGNLYISDFYNDVVREIPGTITVCNGNTYNLSNTGGTYTSSNTSVATVGYTSGVVSAVSPGTTQISYTAYGVTSYITINVVSAPAAISGPSSVCQTASITLTDATPLGLWSSSDPTTGIVDVTGDVTGISPGNVTISYTLAPGCYATDVITVNPMPDPITGIVDVCAGYTSLLSDATPLGTWSSSNSSIASVTSGGLVTGNSNGTCQIIYTGPSGCSVAVTFTVGALPPISGPAYVCGTGVGSTITLTDPTPGGTWSSSNNSIATVNTSGDVTGVSYGNVQIIYTLIPGCIATAIELVTPNPAAITGTTYLCPPTYLTTLSDATPGGIWTSSNTAVATVPPGVGNVMGVSGGVTTIAYTLMPSGCSASVTVTDMAIIGPSEICAGSFVTLTDAVTGGTWTSSHHTVASIGLHSGLLTGINPGATMITYVPLSGCTVTTNIIVNPLPTITASATPNPICEGNTLYLTSTPSGGSGTYISYAWTGPNSFTDVVQNTSVPSITTLGAGTYYVTVTDDNGCTSLPGSTGSVTVNPAPTIYALTPASGPVGTYVGLTGSDGSSISYQLYHDNFSSPDGLPVPGSSSSFYFGAYGNGTYYVIATDLTTGCTSVMSGSSVIGTGIRMANQGSQVTAGSLNLLPNPNNGQFTIAGGNEFMTSLKEVNVTITDMLGQVIFSENTPVDNGSISQEINLNNSLANGIYQVKISAETGNQVLRFTLAR